MKTKYSKEFINFKDEYESYLAKKKKEKKRKEKFGRCGFLLVSTVF